MRIQRRGGYCFEITRHCCLRRFQKVLPNASRRVATLSESAEAQTLLQSLGLARYPLEFENLGQKLGK